MYAAITTLALLGWLLSIYALWIFYRYRRSMRYAPWCDFSERVSCSRAFTSKYSRTLGVHNAWCGVVAYPIVAWLAYTHQALAFLYAAVILALAAVYLGYVSFVKMRNFCIICILIYAVNAAILVLALNAY